MLTETSAVEKDFDRLARLDDEGWAHNNHYHNLLLRHVPETCGCALDLGCGTGTFSRRLAARANSVLALDLSSEMVRVAQSRSSQFSNIDFQVGDVMDCDFPVENFDCIATIVLPMRGRELSLPLAKGLASRVLTHNLRADSKQKKCRDMRHSNHSRSVRTRTRFIQGGRMVGFACPRRGVRGERYVETVA